MVRTLASRENPWLRYGVTISQDALPNADLAGAPTQLLHIHTHNDEVIRLR